MKATELRLWQEVTIILPDGKESIPMQIVGIYAPAYSTEAKDDCDVLLDFDGNEGDVWEAKASELKPVTDCNQLEGEMK